MGSAPTPRASATTREQENGDAPPADNSDGASAQLWLRVFFACFVATSLLFSCTLFTPPFYGDLTRIGLLSESAFGWRSAQPSIPPNLLRSSEVNDADILVIGDSFSAGRVWQSELVKAGMRVATVDWLDTGPLCHDFSAWLRRSGFRGQLVIIESAERELGSRLQANEACSDMGHRIAQVRGPVASPRVAPATELNWGETLFTGVSTRMNTYQVARSHDDLVFGAGRTPFPIRVQTVPRGCEVFSHRACDKGLFLLRDTQQPTLSPRMVEQMASFKAVHPDIGIFWLVMPNKSSIYLEKPGVQAVGPSLARQALGPDLFSLLRASRFTVRDLYAPNDSHLSTSGYLVVGRHLVEQLQIFVR